MGSSFDYDNRTGRAPGAGLRVLGWLLPGVRRVQHQVAPYAGSWTEHNHHALTDESSRRWYAIGDSMSQGVGASGWDQGWVPQLHRRLDASGRGVTLVNLSATGAVVTDVLERQVPLLESLLADDPDPSRALVTVLIGSNDLFNRAHRPQMPARFEDLLARVPAGTVIATLPQPRRAARLANARVWAAADAGRVCVVDMVTAGPSSWTGRLAPDRFHPNDQGYAALADAFEPVVVRAYDAASAGALPEQAELGGGGSALP